MSINRNNDHNSVISRNNYPNIIKFATINVNSIITNERRHELLKFIERNGNPHIVLLSETKLNKNHKVQFKNYAMIRTDRPRSKQGGGTAILINRKIDFEIVHFPNSANNSTLEYTIISLKLNRVKKLFVISAYATNNSKMEFISELNVIFEKLKLDQDSNFFILAGDFNARNEIWGDHSHNQRGIYLQRWLNNDATFFKADIYPTISPSYPRSNTFLDLCIIDNRLIINDLINNKINTCAYDSDHNGTSFSIKLNSDCKLEDNLINKPIKLFKCTNWGKFEKFLGENLSQQVPANKNLNNTEIDEHLNSIKELILNAINKIVPNCDPKDSVLKYVNPKIDKLYKIKSKLITDYNNLKKMGLRESNSLIIKMKASIKKVKKLIKEEFAKSSTKYWANQMKKIDHHNPESFFPKINKLLRVRQRMGIESLLIHEDDNDLLERCKIDTTKLPTIDSKFIINDPLDKLNVMGAYYEEINSPRPLNQGTNIEHLVEKYFKSFNDEFEQQKAEGIKPTQFTDNNLAHSPDRDSTPNYFCSIHEVAGILKKLPNKTSTGIDSIPSIVLKHLPHRIIRDYTILFNNSLNNRYFPKDWKTAKVLPILKAGKNPTDRSSYRPISLNSNVSKVFEMVVLNAINHHCKENTIIPHNQYGFRHKISTCHAINKFIDDTTEHLRRNKLVGAALIDLEKAFDSVWTKGLLFNLIKYKFPIHLIQMIWDMLCNKKFIIWDGSTTTNNTYNLKEGLQQGTVTSPVLFNIFNASILNLFDLNTNNDTHSIAFADDLIVYVAGKRPIDIQDRLQKLVDKINGLYQIWNLRINPEKCETILISKTTHNFSRAMRIGKNVFNITATKPDSGALINIPHKKIVRYLGLNIDYLLRFHQHIDIQLLKAKKAFKANSRIFYNRNLTKRAKVICYLLLIRPILSYAAPIWWNASASSMEKIRLFERKCLRACLSMYRNPRYNFGRLISNQNLYNAANINRFDCHSIKLCRNYFARMKANPNPDINKLALVNNNWINVFESGYFPPQAFTIADQIGIIQDGDNIPIIYHLSRNKAAKKLPTTYDRYERNNSVYSRSIPIKDRDDFHRLNKNYWWLEANGIHLDEIRNRAKRKRS